MIETLLVQRERSSKRKPRKGQHAETADIQISTAVASGTQSKNYRRKGNASQKTGKHRKGQQNTRIELMHSKMP